MKKRIWIIVLAIVFLLLGGSTISAINYVRSLAIVTAAEPVAGSVRKSLTVTGNLYYEETLEVTLPQGCVILEVLKEKGDMAEAGEALVRLNEADLQETYYRLLLQKEQLDREVSRSGNEEKLAYWEREQLKEQCEYYKALIEAGCVITAPESGRVITQDYQPQDVTGTAKIELGLSEAGCYVEWALPPQDYMPYTGTARIMDKEYELYWAEPQYNESVYVYHAPLREISDCSEGSPVLVELNYVSEQYRSMVPRNSLYYDAAGSPYVFELRERTRNYGREYYVQKVYVLVEEMDEQNVALNSAPKLVVTGTSKSLSDLEAVQLLEEE